MRNNSSGTRTAAINLLVQATLLERARIKSCCSNEGMIRVFFHEIVRNLFPSVVFFSASANGGQHHPDLELLT